MIIRAQIIRVLKGTERKQITKDEIQARKKEIRMLRDDGTREGTRQVEEK